MLETELLAGLNSGQQHPLDEMINNTVLLQQAEKAGVNAPEQEVESQLEAINPNTMKINSSRSLRLTIYLKTV